MDQLGIRNSVKVLLINNKKLLMMHVSDPATTSIDGKNYGDFWCPIGGKIEGGETLQEAALREVYEETGIFASDITLGPEVWFGEFDLVLAGNPVHIVEKFIVATTTERNVRLHQLTDWEKEVVNSLQWRTLDEIKSSEDIVFPILLSEYLPEILEGKYPEKPIKVDLGKQPNLE